MYWWVNIIALVLMTALLEISPTQLQSISPYTSGEQWQLASYLTLFICLLLLLLKYFIKLLPYSKAARDINSHQFEPNLNTHSSKLNHKWLHVISSMTTVFTVLFFFITILTSALGQRLSLLEESIHHTVYVDALIHPIGLSDRQFEFAHHTQPSISAIDEADTDSQATSLELTQSYRQLVRLTDIKYYESVEFDDHQSSKIKNPFIKNIANSMVDYNQLHEIQNDDNNVNSGSDLPSSMTVLLSSYNPKFKWLNTFAPTQNIRMQIALKPIEMPNAINPNEFNEYRWLSARHVSATATLINADNKNISNATFTFRRWLNQYRYELRQHIQQLCTNSSESSLLTDEPIIEQNITSVNDRQQAMAVTLSLLTGDRSLINKDTTALYRFAGISHLLAISGAHVLFLAILAAWLTSKVIVLVFPKVYLHISRWQLQLLVAVVIAFIYALFSGFDVPAARTAWMLLMVGVVRYLLIARSTFKILLGLAVFMAWQDIFVLWQAGFWLSFVAVSLLVAYTYRRNQSLKVMEYTDWRTRSVQSNKSTCQTQHIWSEYLANFLFKSLKVMRSFVLLQLWMSIALLPVSLWLFGKVSVWGLLVNIFAIGFFGWIIVPFNLLAGLLYSILPTVSNYIWQWLFTLLDSFHSKLIALESLANYTGWLHTDITLPMLFLSVLITLPWLLPKGILGRLLSLPSSLLLFFMIISGSNNSDNDPSSLIIEPLNLKHNSLSATLITTSTHRWLLISAYLHDGTPFDGVQSANLPQDNEITEQILEELQQRHVDKLTGVIVQTPTPVLANTTLNVSEVIPINYFWVAGYSPINRDFISTSSTTGSKPADSKYAQITNNGADYQANLDSDLSSNLIPTPCTVGQSWQNDKDSLHALNIKAITGWQNIDDKRVWSCSLQITTDYDVYLVDNMQESLQPSNQHKPKVLLAPTNKNQTNLVVNGSQNLLSWQLWQLMCPPSISKTTDNPVTQMRVESINRPQSFINNHHWLSPPKAYLDRAMANEVNPASLHILYPARGANSLQQEDSMLYWQQIIDNQNVD